MEYGVTLSKATQSMSGHGITIELKRSFRLGHITGNLIISFYGNCSQENGVVFRPATQLKLLMYNDGAVPLPPLPGGQRHDIVRAQVGG